MAKKIIDPIKEELKNELAKLKKAKQKLEKKNSLLKKENITLLPELRVNELKIKLFTY